MTAKALLATDENAFRCALLDWYRASKRDLPWRRTRNPYAIWVSEIMLQQTQVKTTIPYFEKFLARFPSVKDLAEAPEEEVLKMWQGLGYYRRARHLQAAARQIESDHGGEFPKSKSGIDGLKGVGSYTSAAIASIAFEQPYACVDGNVIRVITRLAAIDGDVSQSATLRAIELIAQALLDPESPGDHNQAMMELGATVCTPKNPCCLVCPVAQFCQTKQCGGDPHTRPLKTRKTKVSKQKVESGFFFLKGKFLIAKRRGDGLMGDLWELPGITQDLEKSWPQYLANEIELVWERPKPYRHKFTHLHVTYVISAWSLDKQAIWQQSPEGYSAFKMVTPPELDDIPLTHVCQSVLPELIPFLEPATHAKSDTET